MYYLKGAGVMYAMVSIGDHEPTDTDTASLPE